jgi:hypothetical protein
VDLITQHFPGKDDTVTTPKGFKFKTSMRAIAKTATKQAGHRMQYRRSYITAELQNIKGVILANPALLAPKFPLVLAACAFAKTEALAYFRHVDQQGGVRKDCRKHYFAEEYNNLDIASLLHELGCVSDLIKTYAHGVVMEYYAEYVRVNDMKAIQPLVNECGTAIPAFQPLLSAIVDDLNRLDLSVLTAATSEEKLSYGASMFVSTLQHLQLSAAALDLAAPAMFRAASSESPDVLSPATGDGSGSPSSKSTPRPQSAFSDLSYHASTRHNQQLKNVRVNWVRFVAMLLSGKFGNANNVPAFDALIARMRACFERTFFIECLPELVRDYVEPFECWWFRVPFYNAFVSSVQFQGSYLYASHSLSFFRPLIYMHYNFHADAAFERYLLMGISTRLTDSLIEALSSQVLKQVQALWDYMLKLESQIVPIEAALRVERNQQARKKDPTAQPESAPGFESEGGENRKVIAKFVSARNNLTQLLGAVQLFGVFSVYNRDYNVSALLRNNISSYLDQKMHGLFMNNPGKDEITCRPSLAVTKFVTLCGAIQTSLSLLGSNFQLALRATLFHECVDLRTPPPGSAVPIGIAEHTGSLVWRLATWFMNVCKHIATPGSGVVWSVNRKMFVFLPSALHGHGSGNSHHSVHHKQQEKEISISPNALANFLSMEDLKQLCSIVGPQGVRVIDSLLIENVTTKVTYLYVTIYSCGSLVLFPDSRDSFVH